MPRTMIISFIAMLLALGGCAGMSESQCLASDWKTIGYRDGLAGSQSTALIRYQESCIEHGVRPDREAYLAGWHEGVEQYCQPVNAFAVGERGAGYSNVCPSHLQAAFHAAYQDGRQLYLANSEVHSLQQEIARRENRLNEVKAELAAIAGGMLDDESEAADRAAMLITARDLAQEQGKLESEIEELEDELTAKEEALENLRHSLAFAS